MPENGWEWRTDEYQKNVYCRIDLLLCIRLDVRTELRYGKNHRNAAAAESPQLYRSHGYRCGSARSPRSEGQTDRAGGDLPRRKRCHRKYSGKIPSGPFPGVDDQKQCKRIFGVCAHKRQTGTGEKNRIAQRRRYCGDLRKSPGNQIQSPPRSEGKTDDGTRVLL